MRKWRLQLMPLHNLDNEDSDEEELLNDDQAPTFQVSYDQSKNQFSITVLSFLGVGRGQATHFDF